MIKLKQFEKDVELTTGQIATDLAIINHHFILMATSKTLPKFFQKLYKSNK